MASATSTVSTTSTTRIPKAELTGPYGAIIKFMSRRMFGEVPEPAEVVWHNRKVLNFSFTVGRKLQKWNKCDESLKAYAHMAVASMVGCSFCLDVGYYSAHHEGLDEAKAREVPRWRESTVFTPLERDVMEYAEAMTNTPPTVTDELANRLLVALGPAALVELTGYAGMANFMTRTNTTMGIKSQGFSDACGLPPLPARASTARASTASASAATGVRSAND
jgi:AhpD family alkylhydroperoxidase